MLAPTSQRPDELIFDLAVRVNGVTPNGECRFLGPFTQGSPSARFVYVNSGQRAGQVATRWSRRAKVSLVGITAAMVGTVEGTPGVWLETEFEGTGRDGGPTCASVKSIVWRVARRAASNKPSNDR